MTSKPLWLDHDEFERITGWRWKPEGLCRDETCIPLGRTPLVEGDRIDAAGVWRSLHWPVAHDAAGERWVLGEAASRRADALKSLEAPDFELPDLEGRLHRLSDFRGRRVLLVTWASWCGCRADLAVWQALAQELQGHDFTILAIALDHPDAARPWLEAAAPSYPCLIDANHLTAERYNFVNVPQAAWIDERGRIVRPPETAGMGDGFRSMNRETMALPKEALEERTRVKTAYLDAVRDWAVRGAASPHALDEREVMERLSLPDEAIAEAHAHFRLGQALMRDGLTDEAARSFAEASRLHPASWAMWRQAAEKDARGLAVGDAFWKRVDALGERPYYAPARLEGEPTHSRTQS